MDYLNAEHLDHSDGRSLRRFIERKAENKFYDEAVAVVETEKRVPQSPNALTKELGQDPNFMVRKGDWKLIITKKAKAPIIDMMYNTRRDPYEIHNLLGTNAMRASRLVIGKAEHLKCLLVEWMKRQNGNQNFYSDNRWNRGEGRGDITEVKHRRTWPMVNFWQSDHTLEFARASRYGDVFFRHEYLYIGRTTPGVLRITRASIKGEDRHKFRIWPTRAIIQKDGYVRFKVTYRSEERLQGINAYIEIRVAGMGVKKIPMRYNGE